MRSNGGSGVTVVVRAADCGHALFGPGGRGRFELVKSSSSNAIHELMATQKVALQRARRYGWNHSNLIIRSIAKGNRSACRD